MTPGSGADRAGDGGRFGSWTSQPPMFHVSSVRPDGDVWHQVGNDRLTATAHPDGHIVIYSSDAGLVRLTRPARPKERIGPPWEWLGPEGNRIVAAGDPSVRARWRVGGAEWEATGQDWRLTRRAWAPFGVDRILRTDVDLLVDRPGLRGGTFVERWVLAPEPIVIGAPMSKFQPPPRDYPPLTRLTWTLAFGGAHASRLGVTAMRRALARRLRLIEQPGSDPGRGIVILGVERQPAWQRSGAPSWQATVPGVVAIAALGSAHARLIHDGLHTIVELRTPLPDRERSTAAHLFALAPTGRVDGLVVDGDSAEPGETDRSWASIWDLRAPGAGVLQRESSWHAGMLRSAQVAEPRFGSAYVCQGSAYAFIHGLQGAPRDYAFFVPPLCLVDPEGARLLLLTMLRMQFPDGSLCYAHTGAGHRTAGIVHRAPTDLPIALLWAAVEYIWTTGDRALLDVVVPWQPGTSGQPGPAATVGRRLELAFEYLQRRVGVGANGLLRIGSGDWNDPISAMARSRRALHARGESVYNAAFAAYVLPRAADLLAERSRQVATEMRELGLQQRAALTQSWTGRWFFRATDGSGGVIGRDRLFLDANAWCLIADVGTPAQRAQLIGEIERRLLAPSPIAALSVDAPVRVRGGILAPGWDTNGGVWAALNALLAWGLARHDPDLAKICLERQLLATHARAYPEVWTGVWSGPDAFNAHYAADPGATYTQPATPMAEFPIMNANAHAGPLLALMKVLGLEAGPDGLAVRRPGPLTGWELTTALGRFNG